MQKKKIPRRQASLAPSRSKRVIAYMRCCIVVCVLSAGAQAADPMIALVVAADSPHSHYTREDLARIFLRRMQSGADGEKLIPVNLPLFDPIRIAFSRSVYNLDPEDMEGYWNERYFHGLSPPHVVASVEAMLRFVAGTPNALGYILDCQADDRVEVVLRLAIAASDPRLAALCPDSALP